MGINCGNCGEINVEQAKFCSKCGTSIFKNSDENRVKSLNLIIAFYVTFLVFALISFSISDLSSNGFVTELSIEIAFALLVIGFCTYDYKNILKLYRIPKLKWEIWLFAFGFPIFSSFAVYFFVEIVNSLLFNQESINYFEQYILLSNPLFWSFVFIAVLPPVFEELAFRGFLFNQLVKVTSRKLTIIATAFIFALIHFSFISFIWIFPFGLVLGYLRNKYNTLWLGIIVHFIHNLIVLLIDYYTVVVLE